MDWIDDLKNSHKNIFSCYGEDGIIEYLLSKIGTTNKFCVEFGAFNGIFDSNTLNLRMYQNWNALLLDRKKYYGFGKKWRNKAERHLIKLGVDRGIIDLIKIFMINKGSIKRCIEHKNGQLKLVHGWKKILCRKFREKEAKNLAKTASFDTPNNKIIDILKLFYVFDEWITADNIISIFEKHNVPSDFDLLSIDIDGNDYWVWKSIKDDKFSARIVIIEFNSAIGPSESKVMPYNESFLPKYDTYFGASLLALKKLGFQKGYSLIYHNAPYNAFFVKTDLLPSSMKDIPIEKIFSAPIYHPKLKICAKKCKWVIV